LAITILPLASMTANNIPGEAAQHSPFGRLRLG
jgi:hypothetical protein